MKDDLLYLSHMVTYARMVQQRVVGLVRQGYDRDENLRLALAYLIQTIGEAARNVTAETRDNTPFIPWRQITGMRHRIIHDYLNIDYEVVWETATQSIPELLTVLEPYVTKRLHERNKRGSEEGPQ